MLPGPLMLELQSHPSHWMMAIFLSSMVGVHVIGRVIR